MFKDALVGGLGTLISALSLALVYYWWSLRKRFRNHIKGVDIMAKKPLYIYLVLNFLLITCFTFMIGATIMDGYNEWIPIISLVVALGRTVQLYQKGNIVINNMNFFGFNYCGSRLFNCSRSLFRHFPGYNRPVQNKPGSTNYNNEYYKNYCQSMFVFFSHSLARINPKCSG